MFDTDTRLWTWSCDPYLVIHDALAIPGPASLGEVVDGGKLDEGGEDEGVTHCDEPVHGRGVGHLGQRVAGADTQSGHGENRSHTWRRRRKTILFSQVNNNEDNEEKIILWCVLFFL